MTGFPEAFRLDGRVAVVTGAASGIGRATALRLAEAGASVVLADVDESGLAETGKLVTQLFEQLSEKTAGVTVVVAPTDVSQRTEVDALVGQALGVFDRLDAVVNVAGIIRTGELVDLEETELDLLLAVNLKGALFGTQAAIRAMRKPRGKEKKGGAIVNVTSAAIDLPAPGYGAYAISKAGVAMLTRTAAVEAGRYGIRVNAVAPGFVETAMTGRWYTAQDGTVDEKSRASFLDAVAHQSPLGITGEPDDIAWAVLYLVSDASRFMTGQILRPNGGTVLPW